MVAGVASTHKGLTRTAVVEAAVALIAREGLPALSMRRLSRELGIEPMSLYHHVADKDDLLDACIAHAAAQMDLSGMLAPGPWRERLKRGFTAYRTLAHAYPELYPLIGRRPVRELAVLRPIDVALGVLSEAGFDEAAAMTAFRILNSYVYGYATAELSGLAIVAAAEAGMSAGEVPHVTRVLPFVAAIDRDAEFEHGLDVILAGL